MLNQSTFLKQVSVWNTAKTASEIYYDYKRVQPNATDYGLVAYFPLDEGSGSTVNDLSSTGINGSITGASWQTETITDTLLVGTDSIRVPNRASQDFGARMYSNRLGRWLSIDPLFGKYPSLSPYNFVGNSPLIFKDPDGRDIIIAFQGGFKTSGATQLKTADAGTTGKIVQNVVNAAVGLNVTDLKYGVYANSAIVDAGVDLAYNAFKKAYKKGEKVVIYGYSYGGDAAVEFAEKLKSEGYDVDLLITVDAADGPLKGTTVDRTIPDNVKNNVNFYQETHSMMGSRGDKNSADDDEKTEVTNINLDSYLEGVGHGNIDEKTSSASEWLIKKVLNLTKEKVSSINWNGGGSETSSHSSGESSANSSQNSSSSGSSYEDSSSGSSGSSSSSQGSSESESY